MVVKEKSSKVIIRTTGGVFLWKFERFEEGPIKKWDKVRIGGWLADHLRKRYKVAQEVVQGRFKCECGNSVLEFKRSWSDGMSRSFNYHCHGCDESKSVGMNHNDEVTRHRGLIDTKDGE